MCTRVFLVNIICLFSIVKVCENSEFVNPRYARISRELKREGCVLPHHPRFGKWSIYQETSIYRPGQVADDRTILQVTCKEKYKLDGDTTIVCTNGKWSASIGECLRTCPSRYSSAIMTITCRNNDRKLENCEDPTDGTKARFQCADFYEDRALDRNPVHVCFNGNWNHKLPECTPICGQKSIKEDPTLIVGGINAKKGDYPWQVGLYNVSSKEQLCGGSLLNQRVILTAAHCITNTEGKMLSKDIYLVAVGKYFREFDHPEDRDVTQISHIHEMHVPRQYRGDIQNYLGDVAIIITKTSFTLTTRVQPVCVDWALSRFPIVINHKKTKHGYVTGWGYTVEHKNPSTVLKELQVPIIEDQECINKIPEDYQRFITDDKLCAGFTDAGTSVCKGDSGGGLVAKHDGRFYVIGVVSLAPRAPTAEGGCDSHQYGLYTKVQYYVDSFIIEKEALFKPSFDESSCDGDPNCNDFSPTPQTTTSTTPKPVITPPRDSCILPEQPPSGSWSIFGLSTSFSPGQSVLSGTILQIFCNKDYKLVGSNVTICEKGKWITKLGECLRNCPSLESTDATEIKCSFNDKELSDCSNAVDGTIAKQKCALFYEDLQLAKNPVRVCRNGSWDTNRAECVPICGLRAVTAQTLIVNGNTVKKGEYPWQVAIYRNVKKQFICGGALISPKLILTAAHCVTDTKGKKQPKNTYIVAVGKYYKEFYDPLDGAAQTSELQDIFTPVEYEGIANNFLGDIAVLVTKKTFTLSARVQPVCVDWGLKHANSWKNLPSYVTGWGFTVSNAQPSDTLQDLEVPIIPKQECIEALPEDFRVFALPGTLCAGYQNQSRSVCLGDAGGALVTKHDGRYFVTGIVSTGPSAPQGGCDSNKYTLFTNVSDYVGFILEKEAKVKGSSSSEADCSNNEDCQRPTPKPSPEPERTTCTLPEHPDFGKWTIFGLPSAAYKPKFSVISGTVLEVSCYKSYKLEGDTVVLCEKGKWSTTIGKCLKTCPSVYSTATTEATCIINNKEFENCTEPIDGTRVKYKCAPFYEDVKLAQNPIHTCKDGTWSNAPPACVPICGQKSVTPQALIINGQTTKKSDYPWHIGIYRGKQNEFICSGVLINQQTILTAAQCVTEGNGQLRPINEFTVAAGKYYRKIDDSRENAGDVQISKLSEIVLHPNYRGFLRLSSGNIAVLITSTRFTFSRSVQPVCVDWTLTYEKEFASNNLTGYVTGWGFTAENSQPADKLQELQVPIVSRQKCDSELPTDFLNFFTYDKFCAGYRNNSRSACKGDSGGGLVVKFNGKHYVVGIVDSAPPSQSGGCDSQEYALYTKISTYVENLHLYKYRN